jgi:sugar-specific transcriptional regulator TrmB
MQVVNGNEKEVLNMLKKFGLCEYEARMYFTLLTIGEARPGIITRKASVPASRAYNTLERLEAKGFVKLSNTERPKEYKAEAFEKVLKIAIREKQKAITYLKNSHDKLQRIRQTIAPLHNEYSRLRLFSPSYKGR